MYKTDRNIKDIVENIQFLTGFTQEQVAEAIGYKRTYLSEAIRKGGTKKIISTLLRYEMDVLEKKPLFGDDRLLTKKDLTVEMQPKKDEFLEKYVKLLEENLEEMKKATAHDLSERIEVLLLRILALQEMLLKVASGEKYGSYQEAWESLSIIADTVVPVQKEDKIFDVSRKSRKAVS